MGIELRRYADDAELLLINEEPRCNQAIKWQMQFFVSKRGVMDVRTERSLGPHVMCTIVGSALADQCYSSMSCCNYNQWFCVNISSVLSAC